MSRFVGEQDGGFRIDDVKSLRNSPSGLALLCVIDGEEEWIPHSQIHDDSEVYEPGHEGQLVITTWLAEQKGYA